MRKASLKRGKKKEMKKVRDEFDSNSQGGLVEESKTILTFRMKMLTLNTIVRFTLCLYVMLFLESLTATL